MGGATRSNHVLASGNMSPMPASGGEAVLPLCASPVLGAAEARESDSDIDIDLDPTVAIEDLSCLEQWQHHPNYEIGMRMAHFQLSGLHTGCLSTSFQRLFHGCMHKVLA